MAQREEEEAKLRRLCVNNCGFPGNSATNNMCQSCFQQQAAAAAAAASASPPRSCSPRSAPPARAPAPVKLPENGDPKGEAAAAAVAAQAPERPANRCFSCRKRLGLTGFRCRCGELFCGQHRYSDRHECSFDYKTAARATIARENPVVRASKIVRV